MKRIHLLSDEVAMRIAAGEVVINPASVIKELVENSIDADSTSITVEISGGGIDYIRVIDNGDGIHPDDILPALQKHCTSKINKLEDISSIDTLGFRGEALASISAVSNMEIKSQARDLNEGRSIKNYGLDSFKPIVSGLPNGTTVIVKNLFYNTPARRKHLKSNQHETALVTELMSRMIMSRPDIAFTYLNNGKIIYKSLGNGKLLDCIKTIYSNDIAHSLLEVNYDSGKHRIKGYISKSNLIYKNRKYMSFYVNNRYIVSKSFTDSLLSAYTERLLRGHFPFASLHISISPDEIDVNVHPSKTTILCNNANELEDDIYNAVKDALAINDYPVLEMKSKPENNQKPLSSLISNSIIKDKIDYEEFPCSLIDNNDSDSVSVSENLIDTRQIDLNKTESFKAILNEIVNNKDDDNIVQSDLYGDFIDYRIIGSVFNTYLIVEANEKLILIDQHAAHERLNYEELKNADVIASRILLVPQVINLNATDHELMINNIDLINDFGFNIEDFGGTSIKVNAVPNHIKEDSVKILLDDFIFELNNRKNDYKVLRDKMIRKSCRMSIKGGDPLSTEEIKELINELLIKKVTPTCPHGRPIAIALTKDYIEQSFKRIV